MTKNEKLLILMKAQEEARLEKMKINRNKIILVNSQERILSKAINMNSLEMVREYFETGTDVNAKCGFFPYILFVPNDEDALKNFDKESKFSSSIPGETAEVSFLHQAVRNCFDAFHYSGNNTPSAIRMNNALDILKLILKMAADKSRLCIFHLCNICGYSFIPFSGTAIQLAIFLKANLVSKTSFTSEKVKILDETIQILMNGSNKSSEQLNPETTSVLVTTFEGFCNLFADTDFADIKFVCSDGETLQAHKVVLGVSSPYFKTLFLGPWKENECNVIQIPESSSVVVSSLLKFIYTGQLDSKVLEENVFSLLGLSAQYMLSSLQKLCEHRCVKTLSWENIKDVLIFANQHESNELKNSCFDFIRSDSTAVLSNPNMLKLSTEDPSLWAEMVAYIGGTITISSNSGSTSSGSGGERKRQKIIL